MEEKDLGRVFALAAPEEVPPHADLRHRARARGRRARRFRTALTASGAGVAVLAVGGAIALGTTGPGRDTGGTAVTSAADGGSGPGPVAAITPTRPAAPATAPGKPRGPEDHSPLSQAALTAFEAALPAGSHVTGAHPYGRSSGLVPMYVAEIDVTDKNGHAYRIGVTATRDVPDRPRPCPSPDVCGDITLDGDAAWWLYSPPSTSGDDPNYWTDFFSVDDPAGHRQFLFSIGTADRDTPMADVLKTVGLNQNLAPALAAAIR